MMFLTMLSPILLVLALGLATAVLGWNPMVRSLQRTPPPRTDFRFVPTYLPARTYLLAMATLAIGFMVATRFVVPWLWLTIAPLSLVAAHHLLLAWGRWRYRRRMRTQLVSTLPQLESMTAAALSLGHAFERLAERTPAPLGDEWRWVIDHLNVPYQTQGRSGPQILSSGHAHCLRRLADQTPVEMHRRVLDVLAAIYEQGTESQAAQRLTQLNAVLKDQEDLRRWFQTQMSRSIGTAIFITAAMVLGLAYVMAAQWEQTVVAMTQAPLAPLAWVWIPFWMALPLLVAWATSRVPELPF